MSKSKPVLSATTNIKHIPVKSFAPKEIIKYTWSFNSIDKGGPFKWCETTTDAKGLIDAIYKFSEIEKLNHEEQIKRGSHNVPVSDLTRDARKRLAEIRRDDIDKLFSIRLTGRGRVWAIEYESVFYILWWDPKHQVCHSNKKHT